MKKIRYLFEGPIESTALTIAGFSVFAMMVIEILNAFGRKLFMPFPCCLESAESLMITSVFLAIGYVAMVEGHTQVTILTRWMRPSTRRVLDGLSYLFAALIFGFLAIGACTIAFHSVLALEIRIGVYRFPIWVFRVFFALGLVLMALQSFFNTFKFIQQARDQSWSPEGE